MECSVIKSSQASKSSKSNRTVSREEWEEELINTIAALWLPLQIVEHPQFWKFIQVSRLAIYSPEFPSARTVGRRLKSIVKQRQQNIFQDFL